MTNEALVRHACVKRCHSSATSAISLPTWISVAVSSSLHRCPIALAGDFDQLLQRSPLVDLHTGPLTWQIRDQAGLNSVTEVLHRAYTSAIAVFPDGAQHQDDPTSGDHDAA
jgi:hypothetical protein